MQLQVIQFSDNVEKEDMRPATRIKMKHDSDAHPDILHNLFMIFQKQCSMWINKVKS